MKIRKREVFDAIQEGDIEKLERAQDNVQFFTKDARRKKQLESFKELEYQFLYEGLFYDNYWFQNIGGAGNWMFETVSGIILSFSGRIVQFEMSVDYDMHQEMISPILRVTSNLTSEGKFSGSSHEISIYILQILEIQNISLMSHSTVIMTD